MTDPTPDPDLTAKQHPKLRFLHDYWLLKCREKGRLPARADIDPVEIFELLPHVVLWDVVDGGEDLRVRLAGSHFEAVHERPMRGFRISTWVDRRKDAAAWARLQAIIAGRAPAFRHGHLPCPDRPSIRYDRVMLPLADDGTGVDMVLSAYVYWDASLAPAHSSAGTR